MHYKAFGTTDRGSKRGNNEDNFLIVNEKNLYIVADGMGGHNAGEVASLNAVKKIDEYLTIQRINEMKSNHKIIQKEIMNAVVAAHEWIIETSKKKSEYSGMGSTIVVCFINNNALHICHVGDSRAYVINSASIKQITNDHSYVGELVRAGKMSKEDARHSHLKNQISQALGSPFPVKPDYIENALDKETSVLLCSDGLWDMLSDEEIFNLVKENGSLEATCNKLIEKANDAGGDDNITIILIAPG